jgi:hypothetical protein
MKIIPNSEVYADAKLQITISEFEPLENGRIFNKKDYETVPGIPTSEMHFFYYSGLEKTDVKKERSGK